jgi:hypothetical protein
VGGHEPVGQDVELVLVLPEGTDHPTKPELSTRGYQIDRLPLVIVRKRPTLTSFHPTSPGSPSLLQVSINSEEVQASQASTSTLNGSAAFETPIGALA